MNSSNRRDDVDGRYITTEEYDKEFGKVITVKRMHPAYTRYLRNGGPADAWEGSIEQAETLADPQGLKKRKPVVDRFYIIPEAGLRMMVEANLSCPAMAVLLEVARQQRTYGKPVAASGTFFGKLFIRSRGSSRRALESLERANLVSVTRQRGRAAVVRLSKSAEAKLTRTTRAK